jgi:predicted anti-sigma-YlaC factor YlaD
MHEPIREKLEEYLKGSAGKISQDFHAHLEACQECAGEVQQMEAQVEMLRALRPGVEIEPSAGFYARVMDRIETQGRASIWSVLLEPAFGRRLAVACAALVVLLGTYFVATELNDPMVASAPTVATSVPASVDLSAPSSRDQAADLVAYQDSIQQRRQRDAVLVNLASFHE